MPDMRLFVSHLTRYRYAPAIQHSEHWAHLAPCSSATQHVLSHTLEIDPPVAIQTRTDAFGNSQAHWRVPHPHAHMTVLAQSEIDTCSLPDWFNMAPDAAPQTPATPLACWQQASPHVPLDRTLAQLAQPHFSRGQSLAQGARALCAQLHRDWAYVPHSTTIDTPVHEVLALRRGVCQDFAHLFIASVRSLGLSAGYVSGYLMTAPAPGQPRLQGADATHAWVRMWVPGLATHASGGWLHLDPTNNRHGWGSPGPDYVQLALGRDFSDISPLRGTLQGHTQQSLEVAVTVTPIEPVQATPQGAAPSQPLA